MYGKRPNVEERALNVEHSTAGGVENKTKNNKTKFALQ